MAHKKHSSRGTQVRTSSMVSTRTMVGVALIAGAAAAASFGFLAMGIGRPSLILSRAAGLATTSVLLPSSSNVSAGGFAVAGRGDSYTISTVTFSNCITSAIDTDGDCADAGETVGDSTGIASATIQYKDSTGVTRTATAVPSGNALTFSGLTLHVANGTVSEIPLLLTTNNFSSASVASGSRVQYNLNAYSASFSATSVAKGIVLTEKGVRRYVLGGASMTERYAQPTVSLNSSSPSATVSIVGVAAELLRFNVGASSSGDLEMTGGAFKVVTSDNDGSGWADCGTWGTDGASLVNRSTGDSVLFTVYDTNGALCTAGKTVGYFVYSAPSSGSAADIGEVSAGSTVTYSLYADFNSGIGATADAIRVSIPTESELNTLGASFDALTWNDGVATTDATGDEVKGMPLTGNTLLFP